MHSQVKVIVNISHILHNFLSAHIPFTNQCEKDVKSQTSET